MKIGTALQKAQGRINRTYASFRKQPRLDQEQTEHTFALWLGEACRLPVLAKARKLRDAPVCFPAGPTSSPGSWRLKSAA